MTPSIPALADDDAFDEHLSHYVRSRSQQFWTPVAVATRVAATFHAYGATNILDVGCGPGKFCIVAGCLHPDLEVHGIEQRPRLVRLGARLVRRFGAANVRLRAGNATMVSWDEYNGLYFFNPFAENVFDDCDRFDNRVNLSTLRFGLELLRVETLLARARIGTVVITYHGLGGPIPSSYELVADDLAGSDRIRAWVQRSERQAEWAWLEGSEGVRRVSQSEVRGFLTLLASENSSRQ